MGKLKEFAKDSMYYAAGDWLSKLSSLIMLPILSRIFLPSDYGIIDILNATTLLVLVIASMNIDSGMQKYFYKNEGNSLKELISSIYLLRLIVTSIIASFVIYSSENISWILFENIDLTLSICCLAFIVPVEDFYKQQKLYLRLKRMPKTYSFFNVSQVILQPLITWIFVVNYKMGILGVFAARLFIDGVFILPLTYINRKYFTYKFHLKPALELLKFSFPGLPHLIQMNVMNILPRYFLVYFSSLTAVGLYGVADKVAKTVDLFKSSFNLAWNPFAFSNSGKTDEIYLYEKVFKLFAISMLLLLIFIIFFSREVLYFLVPPMYHSAFPLVGGICFYYLLRALPLIYSTGLYSVGKVGFTSLLTSIQVLTFVLSAVYLVPRYNESGLIFALDISIVVYFISYTATVKRFFPFRLSFKELSKAFALGAASILLVSLVPPVVINRLVLYVIIKTVVYILLCASIYHLVLDDDERCTIAGGVKNIWLARPRSLHRSLFC